jgi:excisionase family DNA binding protein
MATMHKVKETADALGVHPNTIRNWIENGTIRAVRLPGSKVRRIPAAEFERLKLQMSPGERAESVRPERDAAVAR